MKNIKIILSFCLVVFSIITTNAQCPPAVVTATVAADASSYYNVPLPAGAVAPAVPATAWDSNPNHTATPGACYTGPALDINSTATGPIYTFCTDFTAINNRADFPTLESIVGTVPSPAKFATTTICVTGGVVTDPDPVANTAGFVTGLTIGTTYTVCFTLNYSTSANNGPVAHTLDAYCPNVTQSVPNPCPSIDITAEADVCPNDEAISYLAGPNCGVPIPFNGIGTTGTFVDLWQEVSTSATSAAPNFTLSALGELNFGDFAANNPTWTNPIFDQDCTTLPFLAGPFDNKTCDPLYVHMHFIVFDYDLNRGTDNTSGEYNDACGDYVVTTIVYPEPQAPLVTISSCVWTITGACPNDLITVTNAAALPGTLTGDGTNVITYAPSTDPLTHDPLQTLDLSVDNVTASAAGVCDPELFTVDIPAEPDAAISVAGSPFCEDAAIVPVTATPPPGELAFGSVTITINPDFFASEVGFEIYDAAGTFLGSIPPGTLTNGDYAPYGPNPSFTITVTDILLSAATQPIGTYTVGGTSTDPIEIVFIDDFGDGWTDVGAAGGADIVGSYDVASGGSSIAAGAGPVGTGFLSVQVTGVSIDNIVQGTAVLAGAGTAGAGTVASPYTFNPTTAGPGEHALVYTYTDVNGCVDEVITYVDVYEKPVLDPATATCNANGTYNVTIPASNISTATWNAIKDAAAVGSDLGNTPAGDNTHSNPVGTPYTNDGAIDGTATNFTVTTTAGTLASTTIAADGTITINNIPAATLSGTVTVGVAQQGTCSATINFAKPCICPVITDNSGTYCNGAFVPAGTTSALAAWQTAVAAANPTATPVNSTILAVDGTTPPNATALVTTANTTCAATTGTQYIYNVCANGAGAADDTYVLLGTYTLTNNPAVQVGTQATAACAVTVTPNCTTDVMVASAPTGGAAIANFNTATGVYTAAAGDALGTITITFSNASGCTTPTLLVNTPACGTSCPSVTNVLGDGAVCEGDAATLSNNATAFAGLVDAGNAAFALPVDFGRLTQSIIDLGATSAVAPVAATIDATHTNADKCAVQTKVQYVYWQCYGADAAAGGGDDSWLKVGTYTLTVNPATVAPATPTPSGCGVTLVPTCASDVMAVAATPAITGGAVASGFTAATGIYTAPAGALAGSIDITITNSFNCAPKTITLATPACPIACPTVTTLISATESQCGIALPVFTTANATIVMSPVASANPADYTIAWFNDAAFTIPASAPAANTTCAATTKTYYAQVTCVATPATQVAGGTYILTINPAVQAGTDATVVCAVTVTPNCTTDAMVASAPTGGAAIANFDATTGVYTAPAGAAAGTITIIFSNASGCGTPTLLVNTPACPLPCAISSIVATQICCYDNGTPADNTDDQVTYNITVNYANYAASGGNIDLDLTAVGGAIESSAAISTASGSVTFPNVMITGVVNADITATFNDDLVCTATQNINQNGCASVCNIVEAIVCPGACNDNGTPLVATDDYYDATVYVIYENTTIGSTFTLSGTNLAATGTVVSAATTATGGTATIAGVRVDASIAAGTLTVTNSGTGADAACTQPSLAFSTAASCSVPPVVPVCSISIQSDCATTCSVNAAGNSVYSVTLVVLGTNGLGNVVISNGGTVIGASSTVPDADGVTEITINNLPADGAVDNFTATFAGTAGCVSAIYPITAPAGCVVVCPPAASTAGAPR
jgi:hypothetical protein